ncbi:MAG TPA: hypothetical protein VGM30_14980 [Puia sp.]
MKVTGNRISRLFTKDNFQKIEIQLDMIDFHEDGIFYSYAPALDLMGYGKTQEEAFKSWQLMLHEYVKYTTNKKTLAQDLEKYGWSVSGSHLNPPSLTWLLQNNQQVTEVYDKHNFSKSSRQVKMPLAEVC